MRWTKSKWRRAFWLALIGLIVLAGGWALWPREQPLLPRSTRIVLPDIYSDGVWISDHQIATVDEKDSSLKYLDVITGKTTVVPNKQHLTPNDLLAASPDGQWLLSYDYMYAPDDNTTAVEIKTGRSLSWPYPHPDGIHSPACNLWMHDSRRWLQASTPADGFFLMINSVDQPHKPLRLRLPTGLSEAGSNLFLNAQDHLLVCSTGPDNIAPPDNPEWAGLTLREYRLLPTPTLLRVMHPAAPAGLDTAATALSPSGDRLAWACTQAYVSPFNLLLHRFLPSVSIVPQQRFSLWVSRVDGSQLHELGYVAVRDNQLLISQLVWLPGGKKLGFAYNDTFYTVPAD